MQKLPHYIREISCRLHQSAMAHGVYCYWIGNSRGAMWGSYVAHKHPEWFRGFLLVGGYPLYTAEASQMKCAQQLMQSHARIAVLHSTDDVHSNPRIHNMYWTPLLNADFGFSLGQKSSRCNVYSLKAISHDELNIFCRGVGDASALFKNMWAFVAQGWD